MKSFKLNKSLKNIPVASKHEYKEKLVEQTSKLLRRMRLKAFFYENGGEKNSSIDYENKTFGFKSTFTPKVSNHLIAFERDLLELIANVQFRNVRNEFQTELKKDVRRIKSSKNVIVAADKTPNFYELSKEDYNRLLSNNITTSYKKADQNVVDNINIEAREVTKDLAINNRIHKLPLKEAFITLKDHKENFEAVPKCRLLNPTKSYVGKISKVILEDINKEIRRQTGLQQWTDTDQMLRWFTSLEKGKFNLMKFDVVEFYPSITEPLLNNAINFAESFVEVSNEDINIIRNSCMSVLHSKGDTWIKKRDDQNALFDVAMGSYSGAETCELVGLFILHGLQKIFGEGLVGIYRDDGLAAIPVQSGFKTEKLKSELHRFAKGIGLRLTIEAPLKTTDFLDVKLDITSQTFAPYHKPNSKLLYVNAKSNHPKKILESIPKLINDRLSKRASSKKEFDENKEEYERALKEAGYSPDLQFHQVERTRKRKNRKRKVTWFNPPFCISVRTNIAREFINLVERHFTDRHPLKPIFNKNNMRVSYCCMQNIGAVIKRHNARILYEDGGVVDKNCNCRNKEECPMKEEEVSCQAKCIVYKAEVTSGSKKKFYIGLSEKEFKTRYRNHTSSFNLDRNVNPTHLSRFVRDLKTKEEDFAIKWSVLRRARPISDGGAVCRVCLKEATEIVYADRRDCLNKRNEIVHVCRHKRKFLLSQYATDSNAPD